MYFNLEKTISNDIISWCILFLTKCQHDLKECLKFWGLTSLQTLLEKSNKLFYYKLVIILLLRREKRDHTQKINTEKWGDLKYAEKNNSEGTKN